MTSNHTIHHSLLPEYDFLVIGAGPGGLMTTLNLLRSKEQYSIALVDKKLPWKEPVACAEAVHRQKLERLVNKLDPSWIRTVIDGVIFIAPNGKKVTFTKPNSGLIIDRAKMHRTMAEECARSGVHCSFSTRITSLSTYENGYRTAQYLGGNSGRLRAKVVIDASGPGTGFGKEEGLVQGNFDHEAAMFGLVKGVSYPVNFLQMFFGKCYAPGGYAWLFPRDRETANIGLVVGRKYAKSASPKRMLPRFIEKTFPGAEITDVQGGSIACGHSPLPFAGHNLFKVGDAASMVNPISRAGILEAMLGGKLAAQSALEIINAGSEKQKEPWYSAYKAKWESAYGKNNLRIHKAKKGFAAITDETLSRAADKLNCIPADKLTMGRIFLTSLMANPLVLWHMRGLITKKND